MTSEQEEPSPEPDAWLWKRYILSKTAGVEVASTEKPDEDFAEYLIENGYIEKKEQLEKVPESEEPLFAGSTIRDFGKELLSSVASKALTFVTSTINKNVDVSIEEQERAIEAIHNEEYEKAVDILGENIQYMIERQDMWKRHMERVADGEVENLKEVFDAE